MFLLTVFLLSIVSKEITYAVSNSDNINLVLDTFPHINSIPNNFRKTSDLTSLKNNKSLNLTGLSDLKISGSQQFSENNFPILIKRIETQLPITVVDLRQESHGFINGLPVSWANTKNNTNIGLTKEQILSDENTKLTSIELNKPIAFYNHPNITINPVKVENEDTLVTSNMLSYIRVPVTDGKIPADDIVDCFIEFVKKQPQNSWIHFHCKHGIGRTCTFMIMYDMIKNYKKVSADDIINRQLALANYKKDTILSFYSNERINFLKNFYNYCKANGDNFITKWSKWKSTTFSSKKTNPTNLVFVGLYISKNYLFENLQY